LRWQSPSSEGLGLLRVNFWFIIQPMIILPPAIPSFPSCVSPQGEVVASYDSGVHGIVGRSEEFRGKDVVYHLDDATLAQCFCDQSGSGIQTNWWVADKLSSEEIVALNAQGWIYVPSGKPWGLEDKPYLAKNIDYSCLPAGNGGGSSSNSGSSGGRSSSGGVGGLWGEVLGLASTGDSLTLTLAAAAGLVLVFLGLSLKKAGK